MQSEDKDIAFIPAQIKGFRAKNPITDPQKESEGESSILLLRFRLIKRQITQAESFPHTNIKSTQNNINLCSSHT